MARFVDKDVNRVHTMLLPMVLLFLIFGHQVVSAQPSGTPSPPLPPSGIFDNILPNDDTTGLGNTTGLPPVPVGTTASVPTSSSAATSSSSPPSSFSSVSSPDTGTGTGTGAVRRSDSLWSILRSGGIVGLVLIGLSVAVVALIIEHSMTIRAMMFVPPELPDQILELLEHGNIAVAKEVCENDSSVLAQVLLGGIKEAEFSWSEVEKGAETAAAEQSAKWFRKIDFLNDIGNIAPMLGLLGTVIGMVIAFREMAVSDGTARAPELAGGIYLALITTVEGLMVAVPAFVAFSFFRNRIAGLLSEVAFVADQVFVPLKATLLRSVTSTAKDR